MKTKLEMAHEWYMKHSEIPSFMNTEVEMAWDYADLMQAEADKRINKDRPDALLTKDKDGNCLHFHHEFGHKKCMDCGASLEEWQPDWSQAPDWANWWVATANQSGKITGGWFYENEPEFGLGDGPSTYHSIGCMVVLTDSFGYTGDWRNSLRKRYN